MKSEPIAAAQLQVEHEICGLDNLIPGSGVAALVDGEQIALFYLPDEDPMVFVLGNFDPIGEAQVMSRGIVGDINGELVIASPLYKHHFDLRTGQCVEQPEVYLPVYAVSITDATVFIKQSSSATGG